MLVLKHLSGNATSNNQIEILKLTKKSIYYEYVLLSMPGSC